jgi:hypothetical protein
MSARGSISCNLALARSETKTVFTYEKGYGHRRSESMLLRILEAS